MCECVYTGNTLAAVHTFRQILYNTAMKEQRAGAIFFTDRAIFFTDR